ncbi:HIT domain-containing protein [bacterium]|jgi:histidine triad (HIT) family protein|nr:HIT domain-containing protein [bacterium]MBT3730205.1 HIT domain-containing protein [bacterium]MBT4894758.1 HIT domain-containing protein [bacterium]
MNDCLFCKIINDEVPSYKIYEDADSLAFLDINPRSPGHVQVIPKAHYRWVWDIPNYDNYSLVVQKIAKAIQGAFGTDEVWSRVIGEEIPHAHTWLFPDPNKAIGDKKDFEGNAEKIKINL